MLAAQALTVQAATGGRLTLGIGLSHQMVIENVFGQSFEKPARHMREYLSILMPLLEGEQVSFAGRDPQRLDVRPAADHRAGTAGAGGRPGRRHARHRRADGLGHGDLDDRAGDHRGPRRPHHPGGRGRGRAPVPRIGVGLPVCVTDDVAAAREKAAEVFSIYGHLPSYRAMLDREGAAGPADVAIVGSEAEVKAQVRRLADIGVTDFCGAPFGTADQIKASVGVLAALVVE